MIKKIVLADCKSNSLEMMSDMLACFEGVEVTGSFKKHEEVINFFKQDHCHIIFIRIDSKELNGLSLAKKVRTEHPNIQMVYVADSEYYAMTAFNQQAEGFIIMPPSYESLKNIFCRLNHFSDVSLNVV